MCSPGVRGAVPVHLWCEETCRSRRFLIRCGVGLGAMDNLKGCCELSVESDWDNIGNYGRIGLKKNHYNQLN